MVHTAPTTLDDIALAVVNELRFTTTQLLQRVRDGGRLTNEQWDEYVANRTADIKDALGRARSLGRLEQGREIEGGQAQAIHGQRE